MRRMIVALMAVALWGLGAGVASAQTPMIKSQWSLYELTTFFMSRKIPAPITGPIKVPAPPKMVMIKISPEAVQLTASGDIKLLKMA